VYDPVIGRVMTADPEVQAPQMSQSYNRYSYCVNNPTSLTDPTGYEFAWGPLFFGGFSAISEVNNFAKNTGNWISGNWKTVVTVVAVVVVTVVTYGVLTAPTLAGMSAFSAGIVAGAAGGVLQGTMSTGLNGGSVTQMMESSAEDAAISAGTALLTEGAAVGIQDLQIPAPEAGYAMRLANGVIQGGVSEIRARGREGSTPDY